MDIEDWRKKIDELDCRLVALLSDHYDVALMNPPYGEMPEACRDYCRGNRRKGITAHYPNTANNRASVTSTVVGPFTPPSVCYRMTIRPQSLTVGKRTLVRITVRERGNPVAGVGVIIRGKGINRHARTNARGVARFTLKAGQPGILRVLVPTHKTCRRQAIGVLGAFTPPVTG